jgi:predicted O-methyltransferase YrrM
LEGSQSISRVAMETFAKLGLKNIKMILGDFDITLPTILKNIKEVDLAFIDGNHRKDATIDYFEKILTVSHKNTVFIFDDINWSEGMKEAWEIIIANPKTKASLDFYAFGVVLINDRFDGHYSLIKNSFKPL